MQGASKDLPSGDTAGPRKHGKTFMFRWTSAFCSPDFLHLKAHEASGSTSMTRRHLYLSIMVCHSYPWNAPLTYIQAAQITAGSSGLYLHGLERIGRDILSVVYKISDQDLKAFIRISTLGLDGRLELRINSQGMVGQTKAKNDADMILKTVPEGWIAG